MAKGADAKAEAKAQRETSGTTIRPDLSKYVKGRSGSGKKTMRSTDPVAEALDGFTLDEVYGVAAEVVGVPVSDLSAKYGHLNVGQQRMNLGNRIRGAIAKQDKAHEQDIMVANGLKILEVACEKPRAAVAKRQAAAAEARAKAEKERAEKAAAKEKADAKAASPEAKAEGKGKKSKKTAAA